MRWGPCHTEKFWQENFPKFDTVDNYQLIRDIVKCLDCKDDRVKAVACFDLGEYARFFPNGRHFLEQEDINVKYKIAELMRQTNTSAEVKKNAISCYQKLLMKSWSSNEFTKM